MQQILMEHYLFLLTSDKKRVEGLTWNYQDIEHKRNRKPNYAVVAEPTCEEVFGDAIKVGRRGSINGYITIKGKARTCCLS